MEQENCKFKKKKKFRADALLPTSGHSIKYYLRGALPPGYNISLYIEKSSCYRPSRVFNFLGVF